MLLWLPFLIACTPVDPCDTDTDCDDGNPCTGVEECVRRTCVVQDVPTCTDGQVCFVQSEQAECDTLCGLPTLPALSHIASNEVVILDPGTELSIDGAVFEAADEWRPQADQTPVSVTVRFAGADCEREHIYEIVDAYPGAADTPGSVAVPSGAASRWATSILEVVWGEEVGESWQDPSFALGPAEGQPETTVPLGRGGTLTVAFDPALQDGAGPDLAVFENSFTDDFLELAFVEVSTDGTTFARFDSASRTSAPVDAFGSVDASDLEGLAGDVRGGFGTPFDLALLRHHPLVRTGQLDLSRVRFVRIVDVVGNGSMADSFGRPLYDPYPTVATAGFDLDAVAALEAR